MPAKLAKLQVSKKNWSRSDLTRLAQEYTQRRLKISSTPNPKRVLLRPFGDEEHWNNLQTSSLSLGAWTDVERKSAVKKPWFLINPEVSIFFSRGVLEACRKIRICSLMNGSALISHKITAMIDMRWRLWNLSKLLWACLAISFQIGMCCEQCASYNSSRCVQLWWVLEIEERNKVLCYSDWCILTSDT